MPRILIAFRRIPLVWTYRLDLFLLTLVGLTAFLLIFGATTLAYDEGALQDLDHALREWNFVKMDAVVADYVKTRNLNGTSKTDRPLEAIDESQKFVASMTQYFAGQHEINMTEVTHLAMIIMVQKIDLSVELEGVKANDPQMILTEYVLLKRMAGEKVHHSLFMIGTYQNLIFSFVLIAFAVVIAYISQSISYVFSTKNLLIYYKHPLFPGIFLMLASIIIASVLGIWAIDETTTQRCRAAITALGRAPVVLDDIRMPIFSLRELPQQQLLSLGLGYYPSTYEIGQLVFENQQYVVDQLLDIPGVTSPDLPQLDIPDVTSSPDLPQSEVDTPRLGMPRLGFPTELSQDYRYRLAALPTSAIALTAAIAAAVWLVRRLGGMTVLACAVVAALLFLVSTSLFAAIFPSPTDKWKIFNNGKVSIIIDGAFPLAIMAVEALMICTLLASLLVRRTKHRIFLIGVSYLAVPVAAALLAPLLVELNLFANGPGKPLYNFLALLGCDLVAIIVAEFVVRRAIIGFLNGPQP